MFVNSHSTPIIQDKHSDSTVICCARKEIVCTLRVVHACFTILGEEREQHSIVFGKIKKAKY